MTRLGPEPTVSPTATVESCDLGRYVEIGERTRLAHSSFGDYSYIMEDGQILFSDIGRFCSIASDVRINPSNHPIWRASQHHFTYRSDDYFAGEARDESVFAWRRESGVTVGHDVWIGHGATVTPGVTVGDGAVIGTGAVVTKDVAPYAIVAGVPARVIRMRFPDPVIKRLQALAWWDWPHDDIHRALSDFRNLAIVDFLDRYER